MSKSMSKVCQDGGVKEEPHVSGKQPTRTIGIAEWVGVNIQKMDGGFHHRRLELLLQSSKKDLIVLFLRFFIYHTSKLGPFYTSNFRCVKGNSNNR